MTDHPGGATRLPEPMPFGEQTQALTNDDEVIRPVGIAEVAPQGDPETIESLAADLRTYGTTVSETGYDIKSSWGGLTNAYHAPDHQDDLYAAMDTVAEDGDDVETGTERAASALETFAGELASIQRRFSVLYDDAVDFRDRIDDDEDWREGGLLGFGESEEVEENRALIKRGVALLTEYAEAEVVCANAITNGVPGSTEFSSMPQGADDGDLDEDVFYHGFDGTAEELMEEWGVVGAETDHNWVVDSLAAGWDHTVNFVEDVGGFVGAHSSEGWFSASWSDGLTEYHGDNIKELAGLVGLYDRESDSFGWSGWDSVGESWKELAHSVVPWTEWEDRPGYVITTAVLNTVGVVGGAALTATGVGAAVGVPLMAWRGASMLDGMGSGPAAGGADGGADLDAGSGSSPGGAPTGGGGGQVPTAADPAGFQAPETISSNDLPGPIGSPGGGETGGSGTGAGGHEGGVPRAPISPVGEASDGQRSGRGGSGTGRPDRDVPDQRPAPTPVADVETPAESTGGADRSGQDDGSASAGTSERSDRSAEETSARETEGSHGRDTDSEQTGPEQAGSDNRWGVNEDTDSGSENTHSDETSESSRSDRDAETADAYGDRWGHTEQSGRTDTGSQTSTQPSQSPSQTPEPVRADATEAGVRSTTDGTDPGNAADSSRADGRADGAERLDGDNSRTDRTGEDRQGRDDRADEHTDARFDETADGRHARSDDGPATHPDASEVTRAGDPRLPEHVREDHPAAHLKEGQDIFDELQEAFYRDSADGVGSRSDAFKQFMDRERAPYDQLYENNREMFESLRSMAEQDPGWKAQSLAETPAPRSGWEHAGRQDGDHGDGGDGSGANSGSAADPRFDGPDRGREPATATAAAKAAAMATARLNSSGRGVDGARAERGPSGEGPRRDRQDGDRDRSQSHERWSTTERGPGRSPDMHERGPEVRNEDGAGGRGSETPDSGRSGDGPRDTTAHRDSDTERTSGEGSRGGGGKPPVTPTGGPEGPDSGSGKSDSGDGSDGPDQKGSDPQRDTNRKGTTEERRTVGEKYTRGKIWKSAKKFLDDFMDLANKHQKFLDNYYLRVEGSVRRRWSIDDVLGGHRIPQIVWDSTAGKFLSKEKLPPAPKPDYRFPEKRHLLDRIEAVASKHDLDSKALERQVWIDDVKEIEARVEKAKSAPDGKHLGESVGELDKKLTIARKERNDASENYGEEVAKAYVTEFFDGSTKRTVWVHDGNGGKKKDDIVMPSIKSGNLLDQVTTAPGSGNYQFDQVYLTSDGGLLIVEAKSDKGTSLGEREKGQGDNAEMVSQGTREYVQMVIEDMKARGEEKAASGGMKEFSIADKLQKALNEKKLHYAEAKGVSSNGRHEGVTFGLFDISTRPRGGDE